MRTMDRRESVDFCLCLCLLLFVSSTFAVTSCPDNVRIELGTYQSISCESDTNSIDFYWYKGLASDSDLVCRLDHGGKSVSAKYREYYDLSDSGSLVILNASLLHESIYTLVTFDRNGKSEEALVLVNISVTPKPPCLVISGCETCEACNLSVSRKSGSLVCSVSGSRPSIPLNWTITSRVGISFIKYQQNEKTDKTTDTWSTSVLLEYEITKPCGVKEVLHCEAEDSLHILQSNAASVEISNDLCRDDGFALRTGWKSAVIWICAVLLLILVVVISCLVIRRHTGRGRQRDVHEIELPLLEKKDEHVRELLSELRRYYAKFCFLRPLPWGEDIPIASLYTECNCTVTDRKGKTTIISNIISLTTEYIGGERRVVFVGGLGFGKTTMTKWILHDWIKQEHPHYVLIYILLKDVKAEMKLSDIVRESLPQDCTITTDIIEKVLRSTSCIILLDGLDELPMYDKTNNPLPESVQCSSETDSDNRLTIGGLLDGQMQLAYKHLQVWVTSRQIDYVKQQFPLPYITVKLNGFSPDQADEYIKRTCKYYFSWRSNDDPLYSKSINDHQFADNETSRTTDDGNKATVSGYNSSSVTGPEKEIIDWVKDFVDKNDIFCDFKDTPLLFILMVHVLADEFTKSTLDSHLPKTPTLTALVSMIITCLESRYVQKRKCKNLPSEVPKLESKLGQIAFDNSVQLGVREREFWDTEVGEENVDMALEVGLLKLSQKNTSNTVGGRALAFSSFTGIEFYHNFLQEYLAARHILTNLNLFSKLKALVLKRKDDSTIRISQFVSGTVDSPVLKICDLLLDTGKWNNFIDCAYEARDRKEFTEIIKKANLKKFDVTYLDKEYHRCALKTFCQQCYDLKIKLDKITFRSDCGVDFLTSVALPQCGSLEFFEVSFTEPLFVTLLQWLSRHSAITEVRFVKSAVPGRISKEFRPGLDDLRERDLKVYRTLWRKILPAGTEELNLRTGKWTWLTTASTNV
ncbi:hypothetical protein HOLleu_22173 [Holothuria leucospilota]|uniref:Ig-like domain-containing protein n=1 Tax=Holothuria leucospilota TaxID=206669 RepID=A0A9Q1BYI6_HOLLE|nr:hypothetical protein HOLleu_22173 [Holothuria leucospilota]